MITIDSKRQANTLIEVIEEEVDVNRHRICVAQSADETLTLTSYDADGKSAKRQTFIHVDGKSAEAENI